MHHFRILAACVVASIFLTPPAGAQQRTKGLFSPLGINKARAGQKIQKLIPRAEVTQQNGVNAAVVIIAWSDKDLAIAKQLRREWTPVVDAIASGSKLTKADAARAAHELGAQKVQAWMTRVMAQSRGANKLPIFVDQRGGESASTGSLRQNVKCPICGSDQHEFCYRLLDYDKVVLEEIPIEDPELSCLHLSNGTCYPPGCCGNPGSSTGGPSGGGGRMVRPDRTVLVLIIGGTSQSYRQEKQALLQTLREGVEEALHSASRLTIKTKSSPP